MRCRGFLIMFNPLHNFNYLIFSPPQSPACMEAFWEHASSGQSNLYRKYHFCFRAACFKKNPITSWQRTFSCLIPLLNTGCISFFLLLTVKTAQSLLSFSGIISRNLIKIYIKLHKVIIYTVSYAGTYYVLPIPSPSFQPATPQTVSSSPAWGD